jgi:hypothetical protein
MPSARSTNCTQLWWRPSRSTTPCPSYSLTILHEARGRGWRWGTHAREQREERDDSSHGQTISQSSTWWTHNQPYHFEASISSVPIHRLHRLCAGRFFILFSFSILSKSLLLILFVFSLFFVLILVVQIFSV